MEPVMYDITGDLTLHLRLRSADVHIAESTSGTATVHVTGEREADDVSSTARRRLAGSRLRIVERKGSGISGIRHADLRIDVGVPAGTTATS